MATGPQHYQRAEALLAEAAKAAKDFPGLNDPSDALIVARAQVHATLAHAAATAMAAAGGYGIGGVMESSDFKAWDAVCGVPLDQTQEG